MKAVVCQVPHEFALTPVPDPGPGPGEVRLLTTGRSRTCGIVTHVLELDDHARALSLLRDGPACLKAVLAP
jgi:threonine dehydrogenase-like Zn-dependent dehydrogenase